MYQFHKKNFHGIYAKKFHEIDLDFLKFGLLCSHSGMRDESWNFLTTFLQNLPIEVLFSAESDGIVQIIDFRHALHYKKYNLSFWTLLNKYILVLAFSWKLWGIWLNKCWQRIHHQPRQSFGFVCFEGLLSGRRGIDRRISMASVHISHGGAAVLTHEQCCNFGFQKFHKNANLH